MNPEPSAARRPITGRHVLVAVVGFFTVVIGLDSLFTVWAVRTFPGEVSPHAYEEGLAYNRAIAARRAQASLGWRAQVSQAARAGTINARFVDAAGRPLQGLTVKARFMRPATQARQYRQSNLFARYGDYLRVGFWCIQPVLVALPGPVRKVAAHVA